MRIAFVTYEYPPSIMGGAGVYAKNVTEELALLGHDVIVFTPCTKEFFQGEYKKNLIVQPVKTNNNLMPRALQFWLSLPKVVQESNKRNRFDVVHFNGVSYWFLKKRLIKAPHVLTVHHLVKDTVKNLSVNVHSTILDIRGESNFFILHFEKQGIIHADKIIAVSKFTKKQIIDTYNVSPNKIDVIYNGYECDSVSFSDNELFQAKKKFNLKNGRILLFVGRVDDERKRLNWFLNVFKLVLDKVDATLLIIGKGDQTKAKKISRKLDISNNVVFIGFVDDESLKKCYSLCDIYVCPSNLEGFGLTVLEAMAANKPIVATNVGAIPEVVDGYDGATLVEVDDAQGMANSIIKYLEKSESFKIKNSQNKSHFTDLFSWKKNVIKLGYLYGKLV